MVRLDRIYTRGGDRGMTSLGDGQRVPKTHPRIAAYGTVDELNAVLGVVLLQPALGAAAKRTLQGIQNDLFDVGADLCVPRPPDEVEGTRLRITPGQVAKLEAAIDACTESLQPLKSFILPGGRPAAAWLHAARVVCRRAELQVASLFETEVANASDQTLVYLNRLSDYLFVLARWANGHGREDVLWVPGAGREASPASKPRKAPARTPRKSSRKGRR